MNRHFLPSTRRVAGLHSQAGIALATALLFLLIVSIVTVAVYQNVIAQGRMAGGFREKGRAFEAAQSALQYGEWWVAKNSSAAAAAAAAKVCQSVLDTEPDSSTVLAGGNYAPLIGMTIASSGVSSYAGQAQYCIQTVGNNGSGDVYKVTAKAFGGNLDTTAVVQSTYVIPASFSAFGPGPQ
ncbi:PilX N-terminal domain-containing pilus assembly protein [uncultured Aquitalea sp.]|uniref:pilus assembly PilX family protein n=1 Tax=uncultured Aquitalea sp. TaxID=540272 RepID=UPI0025F3AB54|nr:PilX N-terminal domain-containing pilus assembly protein [uncultured Aquitalea sp.]